MSDEQVAERVEETLTRRFAIGDPVHIGHRSPAVGAVQSIDDEKGTVTVALEQPSGTPVVITVPASLLSAELAYVTAARVEEALDPGFKPGDEVCVRQGDDWGPPVIISRVTEHFIYVKYDVPDLELPHARALVCLRSGIHGKP